MGNRQVERIKSIQHRYDEAMIDIAGPAAENEVIREAFQNVVRAVLSAEDEGWLPLNKLGYENQKGICLSDAKEITQFLEEQTKKMGGLLGRGLRLKNNHIFGRGYKYELQDGGKIQPRFQAIIDDPDNQAAVFSQGGVKSLNRILYTSGNLFLIYDTSTKQFDKLAIDLHIDNYISYSENNAKIKYVLRSYMVQDDLNGSQPKKVSEWVPTVNYRDRLRRDRKPLPKTIKNQSGESIKVSQTAVIIEKRVNNDNGDVWGIADAFSAAPWAVLYSNYLRDGAKLQNALAAISFVVKAKTQAAAKAAGAKIQNARVGQAAITGPETEIASMPRAGAIDLYEGRPIAAMVAANLDVSTTGLTSDPGPGGSYASENALSQPEQLAALSRQEDFVDIFDQIFRAMGATGIRIRFDHLEPDPTHRALQSLGLAYTLGGINQDELRNRVVELLDIIPTTDQLPEPNEFTGSKISSLTDDGGDDNASAVPSQGNSGAVGALDDDGNNDARNSDLDAGTA